MVHPYIYRNAAPGPYRQFVCSSTVPLNMAYIGVMLGDRVMLAVLDGVKVEVNIGVWVPVGVSVWVSELVWPGVFSWVAFT